MTHSWDHFVPSLYHYIDDKKFTQRQFKLKLRGLSDKYPFSECIDITSWKYVYRFKRRANLKTAFSCFFLLFKSDSVPLCKTKAEQKCYHKEECLSFVCKYNVRLTSVRYSQKVYTKKIKSITSCFAHRLVLFLLCASASL